MRQKNHSFKKVELQQERQKGFEDYGRGYVMPCSWIIWLYLRWWKTCFKPASYVQRALMDGGADRLRSKLLCRETRLKIGPVLASPYLPSPPSHPTTQHTLTTHLSVPYNDLTPAHTMFCANWIRFYNFVFVNLPTLHKNLTSMRHKMNMHVGRSRVCEQSVKT